MNKLHRFRVTGVYKKTGTDAQVEIDALNEANARVKAEFHDIVVTSVDEIPHPTVSHTAAASLSPEQSTSVMAETVQAPAPTARPSTMTPVTPPGMAPSGESSRGWGSTVPLAIGWVVASLAVMAAIGQWVGTSHRRDPSIEAMMTTGDGRAIAGSIGYIIGSNLLGMVAAILGLTVYLPSRGTSGKVLVAVSLLSMLIGTAGQFRPTSESLAGTGVTTTTTPQAKQAVKDMSRMFDRAVPPAGQVPSALTNSLASTAAHGELSHLVRVMQDLVTGMLADAAEYQSGVVALRLESVLLPMRLDSAAEINDSKATIASAQRLFGNYAAAVRARMKAARDGLASAPYAPSIREGMLREYDMGMARTMPQMEKVLAYEEEMYAEVTALLDFMLTQQGKCQQVGSQLMFESEADAATYNASLTRCQAIVGKQIALREVMLEGARANVDRMRRAADTGSFDGEPAALVNASITPTRVILLPDGASVNGRAVAFPLTVAELSLALGQPSRTVARINTIWVWDEAGIYASSKPGSLEIDSIFIVLNKQDEHDFSPKSDCVGPISICGIEVRDIDTPRSLNRRLKGFEFKSIDLRCIGWDIHFPAYSIEMTMGKTGLCDTITIRGPKADNKRKAEPKF